METSLRCLVCLVSKFVVSAKRERTYQSQGHQGDVVSCLPPGGRSDEVEGKGHEVNPRKPPRRRISEDDRVIIANCRES